MDAKLDWADRIEYLPQMTSPEPTLFQTDWWLSAASGGSDERVSVYRDGRLVGWLPFHRTRRSGLIRLRMPPYTRTLGPVLDLPPSKTYQRQANLRRIVRDLTAKLPRHDFFEQALEPNTEYACAFQLAGYECHQAFTFRIPADEPQDALWSALDKKLRNIIRTTASHTNVEDGRDFDRFLRLSRNQPRQVRSTHDYAVLQRLYEAAFSRGQAAMRCAVGSTGDQAIALLIWDKSTLYYWVTARAADPGSSGANSLLVWDSIAFAQSRNLEFDFDGYCSVNAAVFMESFGQSPVARTIIRRSTPVYSAGFWLRHSTASTLRGLRGAVTRRISSLHQKPAA